MEERQDLVDRLVQEQPQQRQVAQQLVLVAVDFLVVAEVLVDSSFDVFSGR